MTLADKDNGKDGEDTRPANSFAPANSASKEPLSNKKDPFPVPFDFSKPEMVPAAPMELERQSAVMDTFNGFAASDVSGISAMPNASVNSSLVKPLLSADPSFDGQGGPSTLKTFVVKFDAYDDMSEGMVPKNLKLLQAIAKLTKPQ